MQPTRRNVDVAYPPTILVVPFTQQQIESLQLGQLSAVCVPLLKATDPVSDQELEEAYQQHRLTQPRGVMAVGEEFQFSQEGDYCQCRYRDGSSVTYSKRIYWPDGKALFEDSTRWQNPATLPVLFCRFFLPVIDVRDLRINQIYRDEDLLELGIVEPVETLVCCHKFCGYEPIPGYDGPEQIPICCQKPETDYSFELAFRQQWSELYGLPSLLRNDYILWVEFDMPSALEPQAYQGRQTSPGGMTT